MEHDVNYTGKLFLENPLTEEQIEKFEESKKENNDDYKWLYAVKYINDESGAYFEIDNSYKKLRPVEKIINGMIFGGLLGNLGKYMIKNKIYVKFAKNSYIASYSLDIYSNCCVLHGIKTGKKNNQIHLRIWTAFDNFNYDTGREDVPF